MAQLTPVYFDEIINDDLLYIIYGYLTLYSLHKLMDVNSRWKEVCLHRLRTRTVFDGMDLYYKRSYYYKVSNHFEISIKMLKLMPRIKTFEYSLLNPTEENCITLVETIANHNPMIEEVILKCVNREKLKIIINKIGTKIKVFDLKFAKLDTHFAASLFEKQPNLEGLKLRSCRIMPEMLKSIPITLKELRLYEFYDVKSSDEINALIRSNHSASLEILKVNFICSKDFEIICENFKNLKSLGFVSNWFDLKHLRKLKKLKKLSVEELGRPFVSGNSIIENTRNLLSLKLNECGSRLDLNHFKLLIESSPNIESLHLYHNCKDVYGDEEIEVLTGLKKLRKLTIRRDEIDDETKEKYCKKLGIKLNAFKCLSTEGSRRFFWNHFQKRP